MPLPNSGPREELHHRRVDLRGYRRTDGLLDVEARLIDTKTEEFEADGARQVSPGSPIHDMSVRLVIDEDLHVIDVAACTDAAPYGICPQAVASLQCVKGLHIGPGWSRSVRELLEGRKGCTHLTELLKPLATVAFQAMWSVRKARSDAVDPAGKPEKIDSCYAYASDREIVRNRWPMHFEEPTARSAERQLISKDKT